MYKKPVIVFEGIEGSGKSFHINFISKYLKSKKIDHIKIREPGGSLNSEKIRKLILDKKSNFKRNTDLLLYLAARSENIDLLRRFSQDWDHPRDEKRLRIRRASDLEDMVNSI